MKARNKILSFSRYLMCKVISITNSRVRANTLETISSLGCFSPQSNRQRDAVYGVFFTLYYSAILSSRYRAQGLGRTPLRQYRLWGVFHPKVIVNEMLCMGCFSPHTYVNEISVVTFRLRTQG
jgi:hypothetical protein